MLLEGAPGHRAKTSHDRSHQRSMAARVALAGGLLVITMTIQRRSSSRSSHKTLTRHHKHHRHRSSSEERYGSHSFSGQQHHHVPSAEERYRSHSFSNHHKRDVRTASHDSPQRHRGGNGRSSHKSLIDRKNDPSLLHPLILASTSTPEESTQLNSTNAVDYLESKPQQQVNEAAESCEASACGASACEASACEMSVVRREASCEAESCEEVSCEAESCEEVSCEASARWGQTSSILRSFSSRRRGSVTELGAAASLPSVHSLVRSLSRSSVFDVSGTHACNE